MLTGALTSSIYVTCITLLLGIFSCEQYVVSDSPCPFFFGCKSNEQDNAMLLCSPEGEPEGELRVDEGSDSSDDERPARNTIGAVPLTWYKDEQHIGYDRDANKLTKRDRKDKLETLLAQTDSKSGLRTIYDEYNDEEIVLSKDELKLIQRIRQGQFPDVEVGVV